jgi:hypothetical protein
MLLPPLDPLFRGAIVLPIFGAAFLAVAWLTGVAIPGVRRNVATGR